ncbi:MAG: 30S ribosomal protein S8 [candidate division WOR-3 bacterium]|uniref:Small ribosomal subunit protein uS8 n=1 Tax=candidate division WOR-3 bacterium TaxID=2052148 RepID=A0A7C4S0Z9_UNCW3
MITDPISDMLTRIRNALMVRHKEVRVPYSKMKLEIVRILLEEGYITNFQVIGEGVKKEINIILKYTPEGKPVIYGLKRISKPSRRIYVGVKDIPKVKGGLGIAILSTPKGILTDREARKEKVGGELLLEVW